MLALWLASFALLSATAEGVRDLHGAPVAVAAVPRAVDEGLRHTCEHHVWTTVWVPGDDSDAQEPLADDGSTATPTTATTRDDSDDDDDDSDDDLSVASLESSGILSLKLSFRSDGRSKMWSVMDVDSDKIDFDVEPFNESDTQGLQGVVRLENGEEAHLRFVPSTCCRGVFSVEKGGVTTTRLEMSTDDREAWRVGGLELFEELKGALLSCDADAWHFSLGADAATARRGGKVESIAFEPVRPGDSAVFGRGTAWIVEYPESEFRPYPGAIFEFSRKRLSPRVQVKISFGRRGWETFACSRPGFAPAA